MRKRSTRRQFLQNTAASGLGFWVAGGVHATESTSPNEKIQIASFGIQGKGLSDIRCASRYGKIYAVCDVDRSFLERSKAEHKFTDFRELLDQMGDRIDAVTVSTPDHTHAVIASKAMKMGKHCYCQKPLTHSIYEARRLAEIARETGVATQMGNQGTCLEAMREAAYQIRAGQIGTVSEVHVWTNRPIWPQGEDRAPEKPVPKSLDWESWIGPAPFRPYADGYHPFKWRGWWDFGTGALGDMACHTVNLPFMALDMRNPTSVEAESSGHNGDSYPEWSRIKFEFPELNGRAPFTFHWYDGSQLPPAELFDDIELEVEVKRDGKTVKLKPYVSGCLLVGDKAKMYAAGDSADRGIEITGGVEPLKVDYPKPMGKPELGHFREWFRAIHDPSQPAVSNFANYGGPLTETILLGNLAVWKGGRVEWDAKTLTPTNDSSLQRIVRREYRDGYEL